MPVEYADFSGPPPGAKALKAAGFSGVIRYIGLGSEFKQIHRAEYVDYVTNGMDVLLVAELHTTDAWQAADDYGYGVQNALIARADARNEGIPDYEPIFWAADAHATASQVADSLEYGRGFQSVLGRAGTGPYGFMEVVRAAKNAGLGNYYWVAGSQPSAEDQKWITFWQKNTGTRTVNGTVCDINVMYNANGGNVGDDMSSADAYNGLVSLLKDVDSGKASDIQDILYKIVQVGTYNGIAQVVKDIRDGKADDLKQALQTLTPAGVTVDMNALADALWERFVNQARK